MRLMAASRMETRTVVIISSTNVKAFIFETDGYR
jgi:hypothetical protein